MIPLRLTLKNFLSYQDHTLIDFSQLKTAVLTGPNGVGKSSLLEAITWALWGKTRAQSSDDLIHQNKNKCFVELIFESEGRVYRILRQRELKRRGGVTSLIFQVSQGKSQKDFFNQSNHDWKELTGPTIKNTQKDIIKTLNLTYDIFTNSSYLQQGKADEFTLKPPQQRKEILSQILNLDRFQLYEEKSREKLRKLEQNLQALEFSLEEKKQTLKALKEQSRDWKKKEGEYKKNVKRYRQIQAKLKKTQEEYQHYQKNKANQEALASTIRSKKYELDQSTSAYLKKEEAVKKLKELEKQKKELELNPRRLAKIEKEYGKLKEQKGEKEQLVIRAKQIKRLWQEKQREIKEIIKLNICPTCQQKVNKEHSQRMAKKTQQEFKKKYAQEFKQIKQQLETAKNIEAKLRNNQKEKNQTEKIRNKYEKLDSAITRIKEIKQELPDLKRQINSREKDLKQDRIKYQKYQEKTQQMSGCAQIYNQIQKEYYQISQKYQKLSEEIGAIKEQKQQIARIETNLEKTKQQTKENIKQKALLGQLVFVFSQRGAPAQIISETIPQIEIEANRILEKATGGRMKVELRTKRAKKTSEGEIDTLDIIISDELGERPYELFSGGEAFRINFSIRVALSRLLSVRAGAKLKFLAVDEGFGSLDNAGQEDIVKAIKSVEQDFEKILVISHIDEIKDAFDQSIIISKEKQGSRAEVIS